ncbi:phage holin family protein [Kordia sp. YSTF-M3]|uniref:Phage holin family protein n=1 Tax=Kordia aestuariivivens TaxID=2759037 RepID=A0ABR7QEU2_9FLAO|nr:phage holin family protein [Kordia aestuariivivens]MBC8756938.1 phage holin family protein [Kordia aestuariivivens]
MEKIKPYLFWLFALIAPIAAVMLTIAFLIVADFITGAYASYKNKIPVSSERIGNTISKFFIYNLVVLSAFLLEKYIVKEIPFQRIITGFIAIAEIKSILENFNKIYGINPFKALINLIKKKSLTDLEETIDILVNDKEKEQKIQKK